jgi:chemotaxis protein histidine kinase CheA
MVLHLHKLFRGRLKISLLILTLLLTADASFGQNNYLEVPVKLDIESGSMDGVLVKVKKDGKDAFTQSGSSKMRLKLDFDKRYTLIFTKDGYVTKTIEFNTDAPAERIKDGFEPYAIGVKLFKQESEKHLVAYNQAVGIIRYDPVLDEFNFDTDYSKSILSDVADHNNDKDTVIAKAEFQKASRADEKAAKKKKKEEEEALLAKRKAEEEEKARLAAAEKEKEKEQAEALKAQRKAEADEKARLALEEKEKQKQEAEALRAQRKAEAEEKAKLAAAEKEKPTTPKPEIAAEEPPKNTGIAAQEMPKSSNGNSGNEVPPIRNGSAGNDVGYTATGSGGNDNSNMVAMADGGDPGSGLLPAAGSESSKKITGSTGNEKPSITQRPSSGEETKKRRLPPKTGGEYNSANAVNLSESITREDIVEDKRIVTIVRVTKRNKTTEYRRVIYRWGGPFYFIDNKESISETVFAFYTGVKD